jgi:hypothetical protein
MKGVGGGGVLCTVVIMLKGVVGKEAGCSEF